MPKRPDLKKFQQSLDEGIRRASVLFQRESGIPTAAGMEDYERRLQEWAERFGAYDALHNYQRRDPSNPYFDLLEDVLLVGRNRAIASGNTAYIERTTGVATEELIERVRARGGDALLRGTDLDALKSIADNVYTYHPETLQGILDTNSAAFVESGVPTDVDQFMRTWVHDHVHLTDEAHRVLMEAANEPRDPSDPAFQALLRERDEVRAATAEAALEALNGVVGNRIKVRDVTELPNYVRYLDSSPDFFPGSGELRILGLEAGPASFPSEGDVSPDLQIPWVAMQPVDADGNPIGETVHARPDYLARFAGQGLRVTVLDAGGQPVRGAHDFMRARQTAAEVDALGAIERARIEVRSLVEDLGTDPLDDVDARDVDPTELAELTAESVLDALGNVDGAATHVSTMDRVTRLAVEQGLVPDPRPVRDLADTDEPHAASRPAPRTGLNPDADDLTSFDRETPSGDLLDAADPPDATDIDNVLDL